MRLKIFPWLMACAVIACVPENDQTDSTIPAPSMDTLSPSLNVDVAPTNTLKTVIQASPIDTLSIHLLKPQETLWNLARKEYGNRHYSAIVALYNDIDEPGKP